jgi:putative ABC transport system substrate-binding protein
MVPDPRGLARADGAAISESIDRRGFSTDYDKFPAVAAAIVKSPVDAIVCSGEIALRAAQQATRAVPILGVADDVGSLIRPGGNTTGISILATELDGKRQEFLMEILPNARRMAALADPNSTQAGRLQRLKEAARAASVELSIHMVESAEKIVAAIDQAKDSGAQAINFLSSPLFTSNRHTIIQHVIALRLLDPPFAGNRGGRRAGRLRCTYHGDVPTNGTAAREGPAWHGAGRSPR